jgi:hypothetical protein
VAVRRSFEFAHILYLSIPRVGDLGDMGSFLVFERDARVHGNLQI